MCDGEPESLPPFNSLDCWDYSMELECLQETKGNLRIYFRRLLDPIL